MKGKPGVYFGLWLSRCCTLIFSKLAKIPLLLYLIIKITHYVAATLPQGYSTINKSGWIEWYLAVSSLPPSFVLFFFLTFKLCRQNLGIIYLLSHEVNTFRQIKGKTNRKHFPEELICLFTIRSHTIFVSCEQTQTICSSPHNYILIVVSLLSPSQGYLVTRS